MTTTALHYTGVIDDWKAIAIPSAITFGAVVGGVLRCVCRTRSRLSIPPPISRTQNVQLESITIPEDNEHSTSSSCNDNVITVSQPLPLEHIDSLYPVLPNPDEKMKELHDTWIQERTNSL
jgi:hypothetical protein